MDDVGLVRTGGGGEVCLTEGKGKGEDEVTLTGGRGSEGDVNPPLPIS
jgi:hypothetical protein